MNKKTSKSTVAPRGFQKGNTANPEAGKAKAIRDNVAQASAIVKSKPVNGLAITFDEALQGGRDHFGAAMQQLTAAVAMKDLTPLQLCTLRNYTSDAADALDEAQKLARARVLEVTLREGAPTGDSGLSRRLVLPNGMVQPVTVQKSGVDPKKFEASLRAKGKSPQTYMEQVVTYKLSEAGVMRAVDDRVFTNDEVKAMNYEVTYRVDRMKEGKVDNE